MRIDVHTHIFRDSAAEQIVADMSRRLGLAAVGTGLPDDLLTRLDAAGLDSSVVLYAAPTPAMMHLSNRFAIEIQQRFPRLIVFASVHPHAKEWERELEILREAGIRGLKLHPEYQGYSLADPAVLPLLEAGMKDFVFLCHMGGLTPECTESGVAASPRMLADLLDRVPGMRFIAAHLGGQFLWDEALKHLAGREVWLDTAACGAQVPATTLSAFFRRHDSEKILFGSDYPFFDPSVEINALAERLPPSLLDRLLSNAAPLFDLPR